MSINFEKLASLHGETIEAVPEIQRSYYRFWRGAHVARIALNFHYDLKSAGSDGLDVVHFHDRYTYAKNIAIGLLNPDGGRRLQFTDEQAAALERVSSIPGIGLHGPSIVFALDKHLNHGIGMRSLTYGEGHGYTTPSFLPLDSIDPYSREFIQSIVEV